MLVLGRFAFGAFLNVRSVCRGGQSIVLPDSSSAIVSSCRRGCMPHKGLNKGLRAVSALLRDAELTASRRWRP